MQGCIIANGTLSIIAADAITAKVLSVDDAIVTANPGSPIPQKIDTEKYLHVYKQWHACMQSLSNSVSSSMEIHGDQEKGSSYSLVWAQSS